MAARRRPGRREVATEAPSTKQTRHQTPPMLPGPPLIGHALEFWRDPVSLFRRGYEQFGQCFSLRLGPKRAAVLIGPESHRFFFSETDNLLTVQEIYKFFIPIFGAQVLTSAEHEEYREQRAILLPAFSARSVDDYVSAIAYEVNDWLATLGDDGQFEMVSSFGLLSMFSAVRALLGDDFRARTGAEFWDLFRDLAGGMEYILPTNLPLPRFIRRDRAKVRIRRMVGEMIASRRASGRSYQDVLQRLLEAKYTNGQPVTDDIIIGIILALVFAAHETTQGHASWALIQMLQNPHYLNRVIAEQNKVLDGGANVDAATLKRLHHLERAIKETERMRPVIAMLVRYAAEPYDLHGYHVPRGWLTIVSPEFSHRLPDVFPDPDRYDPDRYLPERAEDRGVPFSLIGFGGGMHRCLGMYFAYTEMKVLLTMLLQRYELELVDPDPIQIVGPQITQPQVPCYVRYRRR
jgi:sterol 14alpha-demethylase